MKIIINPNEEIVNEVRRALKENEGFCPCRIEKIPENKCMCQEFRNQTSGECHCGLYIKVNE